MPRRSFGRRSRDRRWLGFWRLESRARKEWAQLHKRQEDTRQRLDRKRRTLLGRLRIWRTERSLRELVGAVRGREDLVEGWREDLDRYQKGERAALGKAHADSARQIERRVREAYRRELREAERCEPPTDVERAAREMKERGRSIKPAFRPGRPGPEAPSVAGEGSSDDSRWRRHNVTCARTPARQPPTSGLNGGRNPSYPQIGSSPRRSATPAEFTQPPDNAIAAYKSQNRALQRSGPPSPLGGSAA